MLWHIVIDSFDADFGVDEWFGMNAFIRDGVREFGVVDASCVAAEQILGD